MSSRFTTVITRTAAVVVVGAAVVITLGAADKIESEAADRPKVTRPQVTQAASSTEQPVEKPTTAPTQPAAGTKVVYLTFDDGPDPAWTPQILDILARNDA